MACVLAACVLASAESHRRDRRVVDVVDVGNPRSEAAHGYEGQDASAGVADGKVFRQAAGWMHYTLGTFDDTEVTIACTLVSPDTGRHDVPRSFDLIVEDSVIATRVVSTQSPVPVVVEIDVPFAITKGKTNIVVVIRARGGLTPALRELRTIQDHHELDLTPYSFGVLR
ncbi:MAG: hypothetical protein IPP90_13890 [Gemmatimonadaceae bacterium]|nr:hypothetical protein [Gemmatimonadaceae bacterium]